MKLSGRGALVTGASRGIGYAIAESLAREGANVCIWSRQPEGNDTAVASLRKSGHDVSGLICDVSSEPQVRNAMVTTVSRLGRLDICVACAGVAQATPTPVADLDIEVWREVFRANTESTLFTAKYAVPHLIASDQGKLVLLSSVASRLGIPTRSAYSASKAAIEAIARSFAAELASTNVQVNAIAPGYIETDMTREAGPSLAQFFQERVPGGRLGTPRDIAEAAVFLASDSANYLTGQVLTIDGGFSVC
ncbi:SDR family NAD(P)-dependent oxidoreductase [Hyphomonas sp.]|uniref:SDR family NAD(P)-dependent oxidoreductase n=1 Tax=Hyphomonas sp. TaxID=87 RepID=UPI003529C603